MKTHCIDTLTESDFSRFSDGTSVGRIFNDKKGWYIGICRSISFDRVTSDLCLIRFKAFMSFERILPHLDPQDLQRSLFTPSDRVCGALRVDELPFRLFNASKIILQDHDPRTLIIHGDEKDAKKIAVISQRPQDKAAVEILPEFQKFLTS